MYVEEHVEEWEEVVEEWEDIGFNCFLTLIVKFWLFLTLDVLGLNPRRFQTRFLPVTMATGYVPT